MNIITKLTQVWDNYWYKRLERSVARDDKKLTIQLDKERLEQEQAVASRLSAEKEVVAATIKGMSLDRFQYRVICREASWIFPYSDYPSYYVFITLEKETEFRMLLERAKPERLNVIFETAFSLGFYDEQRYGSIYIRLSDHAFISANVVLSNPPRYDLRGILDVFPYVLEKEHGDDSYGRAHSAVYKRTE